MTILAFGVNHAVAPVALREKVVFSNETMPNALRQLAHQRGVQEAAILSTCNRTEVYCSLRAAEDKRPIIWFSDFHGLRHKELAPFLYRHPDISAVRHILRVASGLDSMILGEPQVLGQLKSAYQIARQAGSIGQLLGRLFQHSFKVAKEIRTTTTIGAHPVSIAFSAVRLAQQIFGDLGKQTALLIGAGNTIELTARHLHERGLARMIIANRSLRRAQHLASEYSAYAITLGNIPQHLAEADIIISATASQQPILSYGDFAQAVQARKHRPIFVVDIAVPLDVEPEVGELNDVYLYTVDDLQGVIQDNMRNRQKAAEQAEKIIDNQVARFMNWLDALDAVATIRALRRQAKKMQDEVLRAAQKRLQRGADPSLVLTEATRALTNKLMHSPSSCLRTASTEGRDELLAIVHELFDLNCSEDHPDS